MQSKKGIFWAAAVLFGATQISLADSISLEFNETGSMYFNANHGAANSNGLHSGGTGTYDSLGTNTLSYSTGNLGPPGTASWSFNPTGSVVTSMQPISAWILTNSSGQVQDLVVFNVHTIFVYEGHFEAGDLTDVLPASRTLSSPSTFYDLTTVHGSGSNGLEDYLNDSRLGGQQVQLANITVAQETWVTGAHLSGLGYHLSLSAGSTGAGALQYDGVGPMADTDIVFVASTAPLPSVTSLSTLLLATLLTFKRTRRPLNV